MSRLDSATARVKAIVDRMKYKPDATIEVRQLEGFEEVSVIIRRPAPDADRWIGAGEVFVSSFESSLVFAPGEIHSHGADEMIVERIRHAICSMELHEVDEFLTFDGVRLHDPHPERRKRPPTPLKITVPVLASEMTVFVGDVYAGRALSVTVAKGATLDIGFTPERNSQ